MRWLRRPGPSLRYTRDEGPICYELPLFGQPASGASGVDTLLASSLVWYWESAPRERPAPAGARRLRRLEADGKRALLDELSLRDEDGFGHFVGVYGLGGEPASELDEARLDKLLRRFAAGEGGPLELVVVQLGDVPNEYLFVSADPGPEAGRVLDRLGVAARDWRDVPYQRLQLAALESVYGL